MMTIGLIEALRLPVTLCMLFAGIVLRNGEQRPGLPETLRLGRRVLVVLLFLSSACRSRSSICCRRVLALLLIGARMVAKLGGVLLLSRQPASAGARPAARPRAVAAAGR